MAFGKLKEVPQPSLQKTTPCTTKVLPEVRDFLEQEGIIVLRRKEDDSFLFSFVEEAVQYVLQKGFLGNDEKLFCFLVTQRVALKFSLEKIHDLNERLREANNTIDKSKKEGMLDLLTGTYNRKGLLDEFKKRDVERKEDDLEKTFPFSSLISIILRK